jgi:hypothetical protein
MGIFSWLKKKKVAEPGDVVVATEPLTDDVVLQISNAAANLRSSTFTDPIAVASIPVPYSDSVSSRSVGTGAGTFPGSDNPWAMTSTVRRFFVNVAAANSQRYDRNVASDWQTVTVERFFMSVTGQRPTINRSGIECSDTVGNIDDAFAGFQWD